MRTDVTISRTAPVSHAPGLPAASFVLRLLSDPMRAAILELLTVEELCVCHLQDELGAKQTLVSHHLRALRDAGLVVSEQAGRFTYYRLVPGAFDGVRDAVTGLAEASTADLPRRPC